jgi:4-hydroxy-tetrahydrodipicolinate reductase
MSEAKKSFKTGNCAEVETIKGSRGGTSYSDIQIHSVRMPGFMASQEVLLGSNGQILKIRHDSTDRKCYMDGVMLAIKHVAKENDFVYGLDKLLK